MHILMVEDSESMGWILSEVMGKWGYHVQWVLTGREALKEVRRVPFDLILMDISLPDIRGQDLIPSLKAAQPETGIVTMTGDNCRELEATIRREGIVCYMIKPFKLNVLKEVLDHISKKNCHGKAGNGPCREPHESDGPGRN